jgi:GT2 family glycosyltransferase
MITVIYSTHKDQEYNKNFKEHIEKTIGVKDYQILEYQNNKEFSLSQIYNKGISESKNNILVCCHNDIKLENNWGRRLLVDFENNSDYAIIGKAGSCYFPESGVYWEKMNETMVGQVYHHPDGQNKWLSRYSDKLPFLIPVVTIDGLFISFDKTKIKHNFDESIGKFHFYDHGFCLPNYLDGIKIGVTSSFEITHKSVGQPNSEFYESKELFVKKYKDKLPIDFKPQNVYVPELNIKPIKNIGGKVAVIIPTKNKTDLLFNCLNSFIEHCDSSLYEVFVADTGSNEEEKNKIKDYIQTNTDKIKINLIEYNYYNFAKINNNVVKNHINDDFKFILFCNNDIVLLNDVITGMLDVFKQNPKAGTVGARLHFGDNTIQHEGIVSIISNSRKTYDVTHLGLRSYYTKQSKLVKVCGNTGALLMIRKNVFEKCGYFNENYISCFEDVELNYKCLINNYENYYNGNLVAYHLESQSRNEDPKNIEKLQMDYRDNLLPFVQENMTKLNNWMIYVQ